jgi:hypothetical protein
MACGAEGPTCFIYALVDPATGKIRYVGKSNDPEKRLRSHLQDETGPNKDKRSWLKQLSISGQKPELHILEEVSLENWKERERWWIAEMKRRGEPLTNISEGYGREARQQLTFVLDDEKDADVLDWWNAQTNKSAALREAARFYMHLHAQRGDRQPVPGGLPALACASRPGWPVLGHRVEGATGEEATGVLQALSLELTRLPDVVAAAVHNALAGYRLLRDEGEPGEEDPELATRLDAQLDEFFTE